MAERPLPFLNTPTVPKDIPEQQLIEQNDTVYVNPAILQRILERNLSTAGRLWLLLRFLDSPGKGWLYFDELENGFRVGAFDPIKISKRKLKSFLEEGQGIFWNTSQDDRIWLRSAASVAAALDLEDVDSSQIGIPVANLIQVAKEADHIPETPPPSVESLSKRQKAILDYLWRYVQVHGRPPTIREIGDAASISSTSVVNYNLTRLTEMGFLTRDAEVSRGLRLTEKTAKLYKRVRVERELVRIPMAGTITTTVPAEVSGDIFPTYDDEVVEIESGMLPGRTDDLFALKVTGDGLRDAMVSHGDTVILRQQETFRDGEMVAIWLLPTDATALKYIYREENRIRLDSANPNFESLYVQPSEIRIQGKVVMVLRQYDQA